MPAVAGVFSLAASTQAATFQLGAQSYDVEYVTGSGANATIVTIDFGSQAYNFGLKWDGAAPDGITAINLIAANSGGALTIYSEFGGTFVTGFKYKSFDLRSDTFQTLTVDTADDYPNLWFGFFTSADGSNWSMPDGGNAPTNEVLAVNGEFQGWMRESADWPGTPLNSVSAVPEPASVGMLVIGGAALLLRRRRAM